MTEDRERIVQPDPGEVLQGDDEIPRQPAPPLDPYTPEPAARPGERRAWASMRWAWLPVLVVVALILYAAARG